MKRTLAVAIVALTGLAGCSASAEKSGSPKKVDAVQAGSVEQPAATAPAPTVTTAAPKPDAFHVGEAVELPSGNRLTVRAIGEYTSGNEFVKPDPGKRFMAIDVEGCAEKSAASLNPFFFELQMPDHTRIEMSLMGDAEPALHDTDIAVGDCVRGMVTYEVPTGQTPAAVFFDGSTQVKWLVG